MRGWFAEIRKCDNRFVRWLMYFVALYWGAFLALAYVMTAPFAFIGSLDNI